MGAASASAAWFWPLLFPNLHPPCDPAASLGGANTRVQIYKLWYKPAALSVAFEGASLPVRWALPSRWLSPRAWTPRWRAQLLSRSLPRFNLCPCSAIISSVGKGARVLRTSRPDNTAELGGNQGFHLLSYLVVHVLVVGVDVLQEKAEHFSVCYLSI